MRNLTKTLAILSLLTPVVGYPLGIGDFKLHSALNQNLNAEIPLTLSAGENAADIKVSLAPAAKFDEAGVPWTYFLSKIKFQTVIGSNGSVVIKVSSKEALKEPFLNLLVEVSWPKGSLYREFTVLIDPPSTYKSPVPIVTPVAAGKPSVITTAPVVAGKPPVVATAPIVAGKPSVVATAPIVAGKPSIVATAPIVADKTTPIVTTAPVITGKPPENVQHSGGSSYGPIHKKETLWSVAVKFSKERNVSVEQMLMAIYEANPDAFHRNNVFGLMSGETLQIPEREAAVILSSEEATAAYGLQKKAWKSGATLPRVSDTSTVAVATTKEFVNAPISTPVQPLKPESSGIVFSGDNQKKITTQPIVTPEIIAKEKPVSPMVVPPAPVKQQTVSPAEEMAASPTDAVLLDKVAALEKQLKATKKALASKEKQIDQIKSQPLVVSEVAKPTTTVEVTPAPPVEVKPVTPVEIKSAAPVEVKPATPIEEKPATPVEVKPATPVEEKPATPVEVKPATPVEEKPARKNLLPLLR
ncbi:MAG: FimV N-terminal domain protein [Methylococcaceae bacterium NSP1-2]|nr:hypothetical protein [Methylococcaceae bacterium]OYV20479.1 MAG: FimV N-terminal domain protein [Methylococcaceae bacterium NSP1-2]